VSIVDYLYQFGKASLVLRTVHYLRSDDAPPIQFITVLHQLEGWIVRIKPESTWPLKTQVDFQSFMGELGIVYRPTERIERVLNELEAGKPPVDIMKRYHIPVIDHGPPQVNEIEVFREQFIQGLGYCPETLA
jgi:hypothetical protein